MLEGCALQQGIWRICPGQAQGDPAWRNGVSTQEGISEAGFRYPWNYPGQRAPGLQKDSEFIRETIKVKAEVLASANGNNQEVSRAGTHTHGTRQNSNHSWKTSGARAWRLGPKISV